MAHDTDEGEEGNGENKDYEHDGENEENVETKAAKAVLCGKLGVSWSIAVDELGSFR